MAGKAPNTRGRFAAAVVFVTVGIFGALVTGVTALVLWLSTWIGSISLAAFVVCILFGIMALVSYELNIRDTVERVRTQLEVVSEVAGMFQRVHRWFEQQWLYLLQIAALLVNDREKKPGKAPKKK